MMPLEFVERESRVVVSRVWREWGVGSECLMASGFQFSREKASWRLAVHQREGS